MPTRISHTQSKQQGFSLVELITVTAIIGIISAIAIPVFLSWLPNIRLNSTARDLYGIVMKAKGEAAKRNSNCTVVFDQTLNIGGTDTTFAYVLFEDNNPTPGRNSDYDVGEPIIVQQERWPQDVTLGAGGVNFGNNNDGNPAITFRPTSIPTDNNGGLANGTVVLTNTNGRNKRVIVNQAGNVRITD